MTGDMFPVSDSLTREAFEQFQSSGTVIRYNNPGMHPCRLLEALRSRFLQTGCRGASKEFATTTKGTKDTKGMGVFGMKKFPGNFKNAKAVAYSIECHDFASSPGDCRLSCVLFHNDLVNNFPDSKMHFRLKPHPIAGKPLRS
ncbi:MAG: hypothetical protein WBD36_08235 [Bacteroidota bacterium]